jgi:NAD(P)H dehydrogenase (quinone)
MPIPQVDRQTRLPLARRRQHEGLSLSQAEIGKLAWCDVLILQFPLASLGMLAILKGWVDRVFALGRAYVGE